MTQTCWYDKDGICESMNRALSQALPVLNQTPHIAAFQRLMDSITARAGKGLKILDIGCGTAMISLFCKDHHYTGCDLPHIIEGCAKVNYPMHNYFAIDILNCTDFSFIEKYDVIIINALIDIMEQPMPVLQQVLAHAQHYILLHRQEISVARPTQSFLNPSYTSQTWHSIINKTDFEKLAADNFFKIATEEKCGFANWENDGNSFVLEKSRNWALHNIDRKLFQKFFTDKKNGFFIEAGANDGLRQSNTMFFEHYHNWNGLLIEAVPVLAEQCRKNRSVNTIVENAALVSHQYRDKKCIIEYTPECYGLMSVMKGVENTAERLKAAGEDGVGVWAPAKTLDSILEKHKKKIPSVIDLMVLDVEGYELEALKGIDFDKWNIRMLLVEELDHESRKNVDYLQQWYHRSERLGENDIVYLRK